MAAIALRSKGINVEVYEQSASFKEIGAGVSIGPNARKLLERLDLGEGLRAICPALPSSIHKVLRHWQSGEVTQVKYYPSQDSISSRVLRSEFLDLLKSSLPDSVLHAGKRFQGLRQQDGKVWLSFDDGSEVVVDMVVGADGIHSVVRSLYQPDKPTFSNQVAYRALIDMDDLDSLNLDDIKESTIWRGPDRHLLTFPISSGGRILNVVGFFPPAQEDDYVESWKKEGRLEDLLAQVEGWDPLVQKVLSKVTGLRKWALYDREPVQRWTHGHVTMLGDAAHAMLPHQGQGAGQSIEDGYTLAKCLEGVSPGNIPGALQLYETIRKPRVTQAQITSRAAGKIYSSDKMDDTIRIAYDNRWSWLWEYDIDEVIERAKKDGVANSDKNGHEHGIIKVDGLSASAVIQSG